jgi:hypothetical protein
MSGTRSLAAACVALAVCTLCTTSEAAPPGDQNTAAAPPSSQKCKEAVVNPVSGYAECVNPRGAPVDPPPPRPPPTPDECRKHADLDLEACRQNQAKPEN